MKLFSRFVLCITLSMLSAGAMASTFRCGTQLVSVGDRSFQVLSKCGEPVAKEHLGFKHISNQYGHAPQVSVTEWLYGPKGGMYYFLRFEGAKLVKISSTR